jgi:hypothetical protein
MEWYSKVRYMIVRHQCGGSAMASILIRIQHFMSMLIHIQIQIKIAELKPPAAVLRAT